MAKSARVIVSVQIPAETRLARPGWVRAAAVRVQPRAARPPALADRGLLASWTEAVA